jgi:hypothetical protein
MNTQNRSSAGSMKKNVPAMPLQKNWPTDPGNGAMPALVRTQKPRPKPWPGDIKGESTFMSGVRWFEAISCSVLRPMILVPSSVPPESSIWAKRA